MHGSLQLGLFEKKDAINVLQFSYSEQSMDFLQHKSKKRKGYLPEEEDSDRKQARNDEIQTRAARQLYVLRQQVCEVQSQLIRGDADKLKHTKKVSPITLFEHSQIWPYALLLTDLPVYLSIPFQVGKGNWVIPLFNYEMIIFLCNISLWKIFVASEILNEC